MCHILTIIRQNIMQCYGTDLPSEAITIRLHRSMMQSEKARQKLSILWNDRLDALNGRRHWHLAKRQRRFAGIPAEAGNRLRSHADLQPVRMSSCIIRRMWSLFYQRIFL